jgi:hypothetical protein
MPNEVRQNRNTTSAAPRIASAEPRIDTSQAARHQDRPRLRAVHSSCGSIEAIRAPTVRRITPTLMATWAMITNSHEPDPSPSDPVMARKPAATTTVGSTNGTVATRSRRAGTGRPGGPGSTRPERR